MFTGLVEEMGWFQGRDGNRFRFAGPMVASVAGRGDSIAVNGVCLTAVSVGNGWWEADVVDETLDRSTLGGLVGGEPVNLELPVRVDDRLGGHIVQGHVDTVGEVVSGAPDLEVRVPDQGSLRYVARKGSVAVDGVSLTVVDVRETSFTVAVIPHTAEATTLGRRRPGDHVNVEFDILAKYVERLLGE